MKTDSTSQERHVTTIGGCYIRTQLAHFSIHCGLHTTKLRGSRPSLLQCHHDIECIVHLKVNGPDIYILPLSGKPEQQLFTMAALAVGCTAHSSAVHRPKGWTLDPQFAVRQTHLCPSHPRYVQPSSCDVLSNDSVLVVKFNDILSRTDITY